LLQLEGGFGGGLGGYLKLEKQYFFECVGLGFKVIVWVYVWQCSVVSIFIHTVFVWMLL